MEYSRPIIRIKDMKQVKSNFDYFQSRADDHARLVAPVLKSDAYGMGIENVAPVLYEVGARIFFTSDVYEAAEIKKAVPQQDVQIYTLHGFNAADGKPQENVYPVLNGPKEFAAYNQILKQHGIERRSAAIQFNTGMNRCGFNLDELVNTVSALDENRVDITMSMTHLCALELDADADQAYSMTQMQNLLPFLDVLPDQPLSVTATHGSLYLEHLDKMPVKQSVERIGVGLYGDIPEHEMAFSAKARIMSVTHVNAGEKIGYDCAYTAPRDMKLAVVDIGYGDGYPREVSVKDGHEGKQAYMTIDGAQAPVVGLVAMNMTCIDVTDIDDAVLAKENYAEIVGTNTSIHYLAECAKTNIEDIMIALNRHNVRAADYIIQ